MKSKIKIVFAFCLLGFSCGKSNDEEMILPKQKFTSLLIKMHLLEADYSFNQQLDQKSMDGTYYKYVELFKAYKTDSLAVVKTFDHYADKQTELLEIYREVLDSLNAMAMKETVKKNKIK
jgi:Domain of unknown function (DUF4296)